jgi:hypothetical protein
MCFSCPMCKKPICQVLWKDSVLSVAGPQLQENTPARVMPPKRPYLNCPGHRKDRDTRYIGWNLEQLVATTMEDCTPVTTPKQPILLSASASELPVHQRPNPQADRRLGPGFTPIQPNDVCVSFRLKGHPLRQCPPGMGAQGGYKTRPTKSFQPHPNYTASGHSCQMLPCAHRFPQIVRPLLLPTTVSIPGWRESVLAHATGSAPRSLCYSSPAKPKLSRCDPQPFATYARSTSAYNSASLSRR